MTEMDSMFFDSAYVQEAAARVVIYNPSPSEQPGHRLASRSRVWQGQLLEFESGKRLPSRERKRTGSR
jgi:hypothetical protein